MADPTGDPDPGAPGLPPDDAADTVFDAVLAELYAQWAQQLGPLSLARLCKRTGLRMSTLKRLLTTLEASGVVVLSYNAREVECAALTESAAASLSDALDSSDPIETDPDQAASSD